MGIEREKEGTLIDEVVPRIAHEPNTVQQPSSDELGCDDDGIDGEG